MVEQGTYVEPDLLFEETPEAITGEYGGAAIIGTPSYMSMEQGFGDISTIGAVSDVWAFGVMLFQALTDSHPLGKHATEGTWAIRSYLASIKKLPSPKELDKSVPPELNRLCQRMLAINPAERMQSLDEFIEEMTTFLRSRTGLVSMSGMATPPKPTEVHQAHRNSDGNSSQLQMENLQLRTENNHLEMELQRYQQKVEILTEIAQLGLFSGSRKQELWAKLAAL